MGSLNETKRKPFNPSVPLMGQSMSESMDEEVRKAGQGPNITIHDEDFRHKVLNSPSVVDLSASHSERQFLPSPSGVNSAKLSRNSSINEIKKPEVEHKRFSFGLATTEKIDYNELSSGRLNVVQSETFLL